MSNYILSCCSTVDISKEHLESRNISYVCFHFFIDGEKSKHIISPPIYLPTE